MDGQDRSKFVAKFTIPRQTTGQANLPKSVLGVRPKVDVAFRQIVERAHPRNTDPKNIECQVFSMNADPTGQIPGLSGIPENLHGARITAILAYLENEGQELLAVKGWEEDGACIVLGHSLIEDVRFVIYVRRQVEYGKTKIRLLARLPYYIRNQSVLVVRYVNTDV